MENNITMKETPNYDITIGELTNKVEKASTDFERTNTELKRKYLIWNIEAFNSIASSVSVSKGSFGTGYPFYALDKNLQGPLPIIQEQIRYNRQLVKDGEPFQQSIYLCKSCLKNNYRTMPDLKTICNPCPNMIDSLKPRKIINRLPDIDMWLVCEDGCVEKAQEELSRLLEKYNMCTSDIDPFLTIENVAQISELLKSGNKPGIFLPIDTHIMEYSALKELIEQVPEVLNDSKQNGQKPYLPIHPKSYRKQWQYDDEAYNFICDFLAVFTEFNFPEELQQSLDKSRFEIATNHTPEELFNFFLRSTTSSTFRRFQSTDVEDYFIKRVKGWESNLKAQCKQENDDNDEHLL